VVAAIVAADAREASVNGTWELGGPDTMTMREAASRYLPGARIVGASRSAPRALRDLYGTDMVAQRESATLQFGLG
jgi:uncharacterized protein YbjT (DUF2867 family)